MRLFDHRHRRIDEFVLDFPHVVAVVGSFWERNADGMLLDWFGSSQLTHIVVIVVVFLLDGDDPTEVCRVTMGAIK
ncbi:MAG: hypothetical protein AAFP26_12250, partial [Planctomycetota bacterium]